jgi:hypothetical protein
MPKAGQKIESRRKIDEAKLLKLHRQKLPISVIAARLGCYQSSVKAALAKMGETISPEQVGRKNFWYG